MEGYNSSILKQMKCECCFFLILLNQLISDLVLFH